MYLYVSKETKLSKILKTPTITCAQTGQHVVQQIRPTCWSGLLWQLFCLTNMCKCPFICYKKNILNSMILTFESKKKTFEFKFHVGQHVGLHRKPHQHVILARFFKQICWPTFLNFSRNVGQHFSFILSFANMFVPKANRINMLANMLVGWWLVEMLANMLSGLRPPWEEKCC